MTAPDPVALAVRLASIFDRLGVRYCVGGSVASSIYGEVRTTLDVDVVADLGPEHVEALVAILEPEFHVLDESIRRAIRDRSSFNVIHEETLVKADVYVPPDDPLYRDQLARSRRLPLSSDPESVVALASPEDVLIHKLRWYEMGGRVSDRQWRDILGVLKVQGDRLDLDYVERCVAILDLGELWKLARAQAR